LRVIAPRKRLDFSSVPQHEKGEDPLR